MLAFHRDIPVEDFRNPRVSLDTAISGEYAEVTQGVAGAVNCLRRIGEIDDQTARTIASSVRTSIHAGGVYDVVNALDPGTRDFIKEAVLFRHERGDDSSLSELRTPVSAARGAHDSDILFDDLRSPSVDLTDPLSSEYIRFVNAGLTLLRQASEQGFLSSADIAEMAADYKRCPHAFAVMKLNHEVSNRIARTGSGG
jgi:hypothetical protein